MPGRFGFHDLDLVFSKNIRDKVFIKLDSIFLILALLGYTQAGKQGLVKLRVFLEKNTTCW